MQVSDESDEDDFFLAGDDDGTERAAAGGAGAQPVDAFALRSPPDSGANLAQLFRGDRRGNSVLGCLSLELQSHVTKVTLSPSAGPSHEIKSCFGAVHSQPFCRQGQRQTAAAPSSRQGGSRQ